MSISEERLASLRHWMEENQVDGVIVPSWDPFQGEYVPACFRRLEWLTGFTGSAGTALILKHKAAFFTDGRYTVQAQMQLPDGVYECYNSGDMPIKEWLDAQSHPLTLAYDPWLYTQPQLGRLESKNVTWNATSENYIDAIWPERPAFPSEPIHIHSIDYAGDEASTKCACVAEWVKEEGADLLLITAPDSLCWLLNIRGVDVPCTPFALAYGIIHADGNVDVFIDEAKLPESLHAHAKEVGINYYPPTQLAEKLALYSKQEGCTIWYDPATTPLACLESCNEQVQWVTKADPCQYAKACKNEVELKGMQRAHTKDGVAVSRFLHWFEQNTTPINECEVHKKLTEFRSEQEGFAYPSFDTIAGFADHGAIVHYRATPEITHMIEGDSLLLIDSGGQYHDGTTDVTRTLAIGTPTEAQKRHFTLVLKGHIALAQAVFPEGTTGSQLDVLARQPLWQEGLDYDHGTGHGVGSFLSVHEGPQRISKVASTVGLVPGMILSNEPGYYKEGEYGIRIENLVQVIERNDLKEGTKTYYGFQTLTMIPLDKRLIDLSLLSCSEREWINAYHQDVYTALEPAITDDSFKSWLCEATTPLA